MGLQDLAPVNSQRAQKTAINAFERFLASEDVNMGFIAACRLNDKDGSTFVKLMDRFAVYLAFVDGRMGKPLARNSVMSYYRQKAPACTKQDLRILMDGLYYDASSSKDYQDAALLGLMWYKFGRASDLGFVAKSSLSVSADDVIFVRLIRVKTSEEQGLSLFPDNDSFITCPLHAIVMALVMQDFPSAQALEHPQLFNGSAECLSAPEDVPLVEALASCSLNDVQRDVHVEEKRNSKNNIKIHGYMNRVVKAAADAQAKAKPTPNLTSHSFRRGSAQHANSDPSLCAQRIFDRGSWSMTATNKMFAYAFSTRTEDQKISRVLSGPKYVPSLLYFFEPVPTRKTPKSVGMTGWLTSLSLSRFCDFQKFWIDIRFVLTRRECLFALGISKAQILPWKSELQRQAVARNAKDATDDGTPEFTKEERLINHQNCVIGELVSMNQVLMKRLSEMALRLDTVEGGSHLASSDREHILPAASVNPARITSSSKSCGSKAAPKSPVSIWLNWYCKTPRLWEVCDSRQKKSTYKQLTNYNDVLHTGQEAETNLYKFFDEHDVKRKNGSSVLKHHRSLHRDGKLDAHIAAYAVRVKIVGVSDPAPSHLKQQFVAHG